MNSDIRQLFSQHSIFTQLLVFVNSTRFKNSRVIGNLSENNDSLELLNEVCKFDLSVDSMESRPRCVRSDMVTVHILFMVEGDVVI